MSTIGFHCAPVRARPTILERGLVATRPRARLDAQGLVDEPEGVRVWATLARALEWALDCRRLYRGAWLGQMDVWRVSHTGAGVQQDSVLGDQGALVVLGSIEPTSLSLAIRAVGDQ